MPVAGQQQRTKNKTRPESGYGCGKENAGIHWLTEVSERICRYLQRSGEENRANHMQPKSMKKERRAGD
jgi:hypothetical protein